MRTGTNITTQQTNRKDTENMIEKYMDVPLNEQETTISFSRDEAGVSIWTNDRTVMTRLNKLCETAPESYQLTKTEYSKATHEIMGKRYTIKDKRLLSFRAVRMKRDFTPEQLEELRERGRKNREAQLLNRA